MEPLFESSDTGSKVFVLDGEPQFLQFVIPEKQEEDDPAILVPNAYMISLKDMLEIFRLFNGIWYGGLWSQLNICIAAFCENTPKGCHYRIESCPTLTEYEKRNQDAYLHRMRNMHIPEKRGPVPPGTIGDNSF